MAMVQKYPHRFSGLGCFDPAAGNAVAETERCLDGGLAGIGELAFYQAGIDESALEQLAPIMKMCADRDLPVLIHTNEPVGHVYHGKTPISFSHSIAGCWIKTSQTGKTVWVFLDHCHDVVVMHFKCFGIFPWKTEYNRFVHLVFIHGVQQFDRTDQSGFG